MGDSFHHCNLERKKLHRYHHWNYHWDWNLSYHQHQLTVDLKLNCVFFISVVIANVGQSVCMLMDSTSCDLTLASITKMYRPWLQWDLMWMWPLSEPYFRNIQGTQNVFLLNY